MKSVVKTSSFYLIITGMFFFLFSLVNKRGNELYPTSGNLSSNVTEAASPLFHVLLALIIIIATTRMMGHLFQKMKQPKVIGEILGGILLGPSFLGLINPSLMGYLFPTNTMPMINIIAQIGILLYMYFVGLEIDFKTLRNSAHTTIAISHASILFPFLLGALLSLKLYSSLAPSAISFTSFSLFLGVSMSITAFPVLARILTDQNLHRTSLGKIALTCAAIDDVTAWCLLAFVTSFAQAKLGSALVTLGWTFVYMIIMLLVAMPLLTKKLNEMAATKKEHEGPMMLILLMILLSSMITEFIGIHALFGAFLLGTITPHDNPIGKKLEHKLIDVISFLFMPAFFAFTGMRTKITLVNSTKDWLVCGLIILVATLGKFGGTFVAARFSGLSTRKSTGLGILMNTRGLVELIVLNIGLDIGVITQRLFTMLVIMALMTTVMTGPLLSLVKGFEVEE